MRKAGKVSKVHGEVCQEEGCVVKASYKLFRYNRDGTKSWVGVCQEHERKIGNSNMRRAGGRIEV